MVNSRWSEDDLNLLSIIYYIQHKVKNVSFDVIISSGKAVTSNDLCLDTDKVGWHYRDIQFRRNRASGLVKIILPPLLKTKTGIGYLHKKEFCRSTHILRFLWPPFYIIQRFDVGNLRSILFPSSFDIKISPNSRFIDRALVITAWF